MPRKPQRESLDGKHVWMVKGGPYPSYEEALKYANMLNTVHSEELKGRVVIVELDAERKIVKITL